MISLLFLNYYLFSFFESTNHIDQIDIALQRSVSVSNFGSKEEVHSITKKFITDPKSLITDEFHLSDYWEESVAFWFKIYSFYNSNIYVIHDSKDPTIVYDVINFSEIHNISPNRTHSEIFRKKYLNDKKKEIEASISRIERDDISNYNDRTIFQVISRSESFRKSNRLLKKHYFKELKSNIRIQAGQKDMIEQGILNSQKYKLYIYNLLTIANLPKELIAIPFLESSFNTNATSKVGANGIWQIMPIIEKSIFKENKIRYSSNPLSATMAAVTLLRTNYNYLKRLDLTVTSYNSGLKHILLAKNKFNIPFKDLSLEYIFTNYQHEHLGFASRNFYAEFLALVYTLNYFDHIFDTPYIENLPNYQQNNLPQIYISTCDFIYNKNLYNDFPTEINGHLELNQKYKKGTFIFSPTKSQFKNYKNLSYDEIAKGNLDLIIKRSQKEICSKV